MNGRRYFDDVDLYQSNLTKLQTLHNLMKEMNRNENALVLDSLIGQDAITRLNFIREKFNQSEFLASSDSSFSSWQGGSGFMRIGFGISDKIELSEVLKTQLNRIETLSNLAKIYLSVVPKKYLSLKEMEHWEFIGNEIELYKLKDASGSLTRLEKFLENLTEDFSLDQCAKVLSQYRPKINTSNFFSMRFAKIHSSIQNRCNAIKGQTAKQQWLIFSNDFDKYLGGKKPFLEPKRIGINKKAYKNESNVDLYNLSDYFTRIPNKIIIDNLFENSQDKINALKFYEDVNRIKDLFSTLTLKKSEGTRGFDLNIKFRVNQQREIFGNRIIDWKMNVGSESISLRDEQKTMRWTPGDKVTLKFRFAANTSVSPFGDYNDPFYEVNKKTATFRYDDLWSIFDLIQVHRLQNVKDIENRVDQYLMFEFPLVMDNSENEISDDSKSNARIYMMINLIDPITKKKISWPNNFPIKSPVFTNSFVTNILEKELSGFTNE
jgi:RNA binding exosome subunit